MPGDLRECPASRPLVTRAWLTTSIILKSLLNLHNTCESIICTLSDKVRDSEEGILCVGYSRTTGKSGETGLEDRKDNKSHLPLLIFEVSLDRLWLMLYVFLMTK